MATVSRTDLRNLCLLALVLVTVLATRSASPAAGSTICPAVHVGRIPLA